MASRTTIARRLRAMTSDQRRIYRAARLEGFDRAHAIEWATAPIAALRLRFDLLAGKA